MNNYIYRNNYRPEGGTWKQFKMVATRHNGTHEIRFVDKYEYTSIARQMLDIFKNAINAVFTKVVFYDCSRGNLALHATFPDDLN